MATKQIKLVSGAQKLDPQVMAKKIEGIVRTSLYKGANDALVEYRDGTVAKKTGALRQAVNRMLDDQIDLLRAGKASQIIRFDMNKLNSRLNYAKYHVMAPTGDRKSANYKEPTTSGTAPIVPSDLMSDIANNARKEVLLALSAGGFKFESLSSSQKKRVRSVT